MIFCLDLQIPGLTAVRLIGSMQLTAPNPSFPAGTVVTSSVSRVYTPVSEQSAFYLISFLSLLKAQVEMLSWGFIKFVDKFFVLIINNKRQPKIL